MNLKNFIERKGYIFIVYEFYNFNCNYYLLGSDCMKEFLRMYLL